MTRWTHGGAAAALADMTPVAHDAGFLLGWYGSTAMRDSGKDLDLIAMPWRPDARVRELELLLCTRLPLTSAAPKYFGLIPGAVSIALVDSRGAQIDLQVRCLPDDPGGQRIERGIALYEPNEVYRSAPPGEVHFVQGGKVAAKIVNLSKP